MEVRVIACIQRTKSNDDVVVGDVKSLHVVLLRAVC